MMPSKQRAKFDELLGHFLIKIRSVIRSKIFLKNNLLTRKRSKVQDKNGVTKQSFSSIPSSYFGNVFVKPSAVFVLLTFVLFFWAQEKNPHKFPFIRFV